MRMKRVLTLVLAFVWILGSVPAAAQEIIFEGEACPLTVIYNLQEYKNQHGGDEAGAASMKAAAEGDEAALSEAQTAESAAAGAESAAIDSTAAGAESAAAESTAAGAENAAAADTEGTAASEGAAADAAANVPVFEEKEVESMDLLCVVDDEYVAALLDGSKVYFLYDEISEHVPDYDLKKLPAVSGWTDFGNGNSGDVAKAVQEALISLGYLEGTADGFFGAMSETALISFQTAEKLQATGIADVFTWGLLMEMASGKPNAIQVTYPQVYTLEEKFESIYRNVTDPSVLEEYVGPEWKFSYDVFKGIGEITPKEADLGSWSDESGRAVDRLAIEIRRIVYVLRNDKGVVELSPALEARSVGAYRPYIKQGLLRRGNDVIELPLIEEDGWVEGPDVIEQAVLALESEDLFGKEAEEELVLRLNGAIMDYDMILE